MSGTLWFLIDWVGSQALPFPAPSRSHCPVQSGYLDGSGAWAAAVLAANRSAATAIEVRRSMVGFRLMALRPIVAGMEASAMRGDQMSPRRLRQLLILGGRPLCRRPLPAAPRIGDELLALRHPLEHHAPAQKRADDYVRGGELLAENPGPCAHRIRQHVERRVVFAIAERGARCLLLARKHAIHHGGLGTARREEQPLQVMSAPRIAERYVEARPREGVGQIRADRRHLGDDDVAVPERTL